MYINNMIDFTQISNSWEHSILIYFFCRMKLFIFVFSCICLNDYDPPHNKVETKVDV